MQNSFRFDGDKTFSDKQEFKTFATSNPSMQWIVNDLAQNQVSEDKNHPSLYEKMMKNSLHL